MVADNEAVQLSDYCFNVCEALNAAIRDRNTDDLGESTRMALKDLVRCVASSRVLVAVRALA